MSIFKSVFKVLCLETQRWKRLDGVPRLAEVVQGVKFVDEIREEEDASLGSYTKVDSNSAIYYRAGIHLTLRQEFQKFA